MFQHPDHYHNLSLRLCQVMDDIGVNERVVLSRRRTWLRNETILNIKCCIEDNNVSNFFFGSQTEGSTTLDLNSDVDLLYCLQTTQVIQDWTEWNPGMLQHLMVQDETTSPGHCLLRAVARVIPVPIPPILQFKYHSTDSMGRVLLNHSWSIGDISEGVIRHGPARATYRGPYDQCDHEIIHGPALASSPRLKVQCDSDIVSAISCQSWPKESEPWLHQQTINGWPTADIKRYAAENGCFVVPVASRANVNQETEWRISTSLAERCLMFSLNMTQIRCYILMKMIIKTYFKPNCEDAISSYMCKTVLFHCIADSGANQWNESRLVPCLNQCLQYLFYCILTENLPHFITPGNNLLAGKLSYQIKQQVVEIMIRLTTNIEQSLLGIWIDQLGHRLHVKSGGLYAGHLATLEHIAGLILATNTCYAAGGIQICLNDVLNETCPNNIFSLYQRLTHSVYKLCQIYSTGNRLEQATCEFCAPLFCACIGSTIASVNIYRGQAVSPAALMWFSVGLNSDFSSSRLKLASALYCAGHYEQCEAILFHLTRRPELTTVLSECKCYPKRRVFTSEYQRLCIERNEAYVIQHCIAFCVRFLLCEVNCVPEELRYEMFRSTEEDLQYRGIEDHWMDWAVIDSKPYLYFLQFKVYSQLHSPIQQQLALLNLAWTIDTEPNLGHKETAMNLLGQCMEHISRRYSAFRCYMMSLNIKPRNNAAKWHISRLLASQFNR